MLSPKEFHSCCTGIGTLMTEEEVAAKIKEIDTDGSGMITFEEFTSFMMARMVEPGHTKVEVGNCFVQLGEEEPFVTKVQLVRSFTNNEHLEYDQVSHTQAHPHQPLSLTLIPVSVSFCLRQSPSYVLANCAPSSAEGAAEEEDPLDYPSFVEQLFSR